MGTNPCARPTHLVMSICSFGSVHMHNFLDGFVTMIMVLPQAVVDILCFGFSFVVSRQGPLGVYFQLQL